MKVHHVGYAVKSIERTRVRMKLLGFEEDSAVIEDDYQNILVLFMRNPDGASVELIEPMNKSRESPVDAVLADGGVQPYHVCFECVDIENRILELRKQHYAVTAGPFPAVGVHGRRVAFLMHRDMGLIELLEV